MLYIGNFLFVTNQQSVDEGVRRHGEFNLMIEADEESKAIIKFKERIQAFRDSSDFFEGDCAIYFSRLLQFSEIPAKQAEMVNYKSFAGDPIMPFIECSLPSVESNACTILEWNRNKPEMEGRKNNLFIDFEGDDGNS